MEVHKLTCAVTAENPDEMIFATFSGIEAECCVVSFARPQKDWWVIPDIKKISGVECLEEKKLGIPMPSVLFAIIHYGLLQEEGFKGALLENSMIKVATQSSKGVYQMDFKIGMGVRGCDGNPHGAIMGEAYAITPLMALEDLEFFAAGQNNLPA